MIIRSCTETTIFEGALLFQSFLHFGKVSLPAGICKPCNIIIRIYNPVNNPDVLLFFFPPHFQNNFQQICSFDKRDTKRILIKWFYRLNKC